MCVCTRLLNTHTHTHFPVQISPPAVHFSLALWSLFVSLCPSLQTPILFFFSFSPLLLHFMCFCFPSSFCLCVWFPFFFPQSMFRVSYQIFHHVTVNKVKSSTLFFLHLFFFFLPTPVASQRLVLPPVSGMQPWCNTKCFSVLNLQVSGVLLNVDLFW